MNRYPDYKASRTEGVDVLPSHWQEAKFKRVAELLYGESLPASTRTEGEVPVYGSNGITDYHNLPLSQSPCIIIGRKGSFGKVNYSDAPCFPIDTTFYVDSTSTKHDLRWIYYLLKALRLDSFSKDSAVPGINREEIYEREVGIPPLDEQRQLAAYLDRKTAEVDTLIRKKQALIARLGELRAALIHRAVTKGLDPDVPMKDSGVEWLGEVPEHWTIPQLKYTTQFVNGAAFKPDEWVSEGVPIIRISNLNGDPDFNHSAENMSERYHVREGNLLFAWSGNRGTSFGPFLWARQGLHYLNQHIFRLEGYDYDTRYFYWMLKTVTTHVEEQAHGIIGMVHITKGDLGAIRVPEMPKAEQLAIARYLDGTTGQIDSIAEREGKLIEHLRELRTSLISEVVTGKIDVRAEPLAEVAA